MRIYIFCSTILTSFTQCKLLKKEQARFQRLVQSFSENNDVEYKTNLAIFFNVLLNVATDPEIFEGIKVDLMKSDILAKAKAVNMPSEDYANQVKVLEEQLTTDIVSQMLEQEESGYTFIDFAKAINTRIANEDEQILLRDMFQFMLRLVEKTKGFVIFCLNSFL